MMRPGLVLISISLEGTHTLHSEITGSPLAFDKTLTGLAALSEYKAKYKKKFPLIELKSVITEENAHELYDIYTIAKRNQVDIFNVMVINLLPQANRLHHDPFVSCSISPPIVKNIEPNLLRRQLNKSRTPSRRYSSKTGMHRYRRPSSYTAMNVTAVAGNNHAGR